MGLVAMLMTCMCNSISIVLHQWCTKYIGVPDSSLGFFTHIDLHICSCIDSSGSPKPAYWASKFLLINLLSSLTYIMRCLIGGTLAALLHVLCVAQPALSSPYEGSSLIQRSDDKGLGEQSFGDLGPLKWNPTSYGKDPSAQTSMDSEQVEGKAK